jgi:hypothetical protein
MSGSAIPSVSGSPAAVRSEEKKSASVASVPSGMSGASSIQSASIPAGTVVVDAALFAQLMAAAAKPQVPESITLKDGSKYTGEVKDGVPHGKGTLEYPKGNPGNLLSFEGEFQNGLPHGKGTLRRMDKAQFEGYMELGIPKDGKFTNATKDRVLNGTFDFDEKTGVFKLIKGTDRTLCFDGWSSETIDTTNKENCVIQ